MIYSLSNGISSKRFETMRKQHILQTLLWVPLFFFLFLCSFRYRKILLTLLLLFSSSLLLFFSEIYYHINGIVEAAFQSENSGYNIFFLFFSLLSSSLYYTIYIVCAVCACQLSIHISVYFCYFFFFFNEHTA